MYIIILNISMSKILQNDKFGIHTYTNERVSLSSPLIPISSHHPPTHPSIIDLLIHLIYYYKKTTTNNNPTSRFNAMILL